MALLIDDIPTDPANSPDLSLGTDPVDGRLAGLEGDEVTADRGKAQRGATVDDSRERPVLGTLGQENVRRGDGDRCVTGV